MGNGGTAVRVGMRVDGLERIGRVLVLPEKQGRVQATEGRDCGAEWAHAAAASVDS